MVRQGSISKEIAKMLNLSVHPLGRHRHSIRKKIKRIFLYVCRPLIFPTSKPSGFPASKPISMSSLLRSQRLRTFTTSHLLTFSPTLRPSFSPSLHPSLQTSQLPSFPAFFYELRAISYFYFNVMAVFTSPVLVPSCCQRAVTVLVWV